MYDLAKLLPAENSWLIDNEIQINNAGQILVTASNDGYKRVRLEPVRHEQIREAESESSKHAQR